MKLLWAVCARAGNSSGLIGSLSPALHREGRLALAVNIGVYAVVFCRPGALGKVLGGSPDSPPG